MGDWRMMFSVLGKSSATMEIGAAQRAQTHIVECQITSHSTMMVPNNESSRDPIVCSHIG